MIKKTINTLVLATVDSITKFKNKLAYYLAIFAMVFGSTFGTLNSANAADLVATEDGTSGTNLFNAGGTPASIAAADTIDLVTFTVTIDEALDLGTTAIGAVTGTTGALTLQSTDTADNTAKMTSFITTGAGTLNILNETASANSAFAVTSSGNITTVGGTINITADTNSTEQTSLVVLGATITANVVLDETGTGTALLDLDSASALQTLTGTINGVGAGEGTLKLQGGHANGNVITGAIGNNFSIKLLDSDVNSTFSSTVAATTIDLEGTSTFAGDVTATTITSNGSAKVVTFNGDVNATTMTITQASVDANADITTNVVLDHAEGDLLVSGAVDQTLTGTITSLTAGEGSLIITNTGELTVTGQIGTDALRLLEVTANDASNVTFQSKMFAETLDINSNAAGEYVQVTAGNVIGTKDGAAGEIEIATGAVIHLDTAVIAGTTVFDMQSAGTDDEAFESAGAFTIIPSSSFVSGTVEFIEGGTNADILDTASDTDAAAELVNFNVQDSAIIDYTVASGTTAGADVVITAADKAKATIASELGTTTNHADALLNANKAIAASGTSADKTIFNNAINAFGTQTATSDTALAKQVAPQDDMISGSTFAAKAMTGSLQGIMSNRMASLRSGDAFMTGMSAGNGMSANSGFIQAFGTEAEQKNKTVGSGTQFGYDASSAGLALGFDGITDNGSVVGLSFSMSNTDVDGKGTGNSKNDIDSYTVSVYADKTTDAGYIEGSLTVGLNENNSSRIVNTAGLDRTYKGDYDSEQVSLKIGGGMPNAVGTGFVTPYGSVTATRITTDAYTETSTTASDALRLRVAQDDVDSIVGTVGLKYHTVLDNGGTPMISLAINNEFGDNTINSTNTYQGGGTAFTTSTDVEELSATLGLGYSFRSDNTTLELAYEADANDDDYLGHYGSIKIVSKF